MKRDNIKKLTIWQQMLCTIIACMSTTVAVAIASQDMGPFSPYVGLDAQQRGLTMAPGFGEGMFKKNILQYNLFTGLMFNEYIGFEIGQEFTENTPKTNLVRPGDPMLGILVDSETTYITKNTIGIYGTNFNITGRLPLNIGNLHLLGSIGMVSLKTKAKFQILAANDADGFSTVNSNDPLIRNFSTRRFIPRFTAGIGFQVTKRMRIRTLATYEQTSKFKRISPKEIDSPLRITLKNNLSAGIGIDFTL